MLHKALCPDHLEHAIAAALLQYQLSPLHGVMLAVTGITALPACSCSP